jgi:LPS export ABC transporter protein LptC
MESHTRNLLLFLVLTGAALATWMLAREPEPPAEASSQDAVRTRNTYMTDALIYATDEDGKIRFRIEAARLEQSEADGDQLLLQDMRVRYAPELEVNWNISAATSIASENLSRLHLMDDVRLTLSPGGVKDDLIVETGAADLYADEFRVASGQTATVRQGTTRSTGKDLLINLKEESVSLADAVIRYAQ